MGADALRGARQILNFGTFFSIGSTGIFILQSVGIIPFYIYPVNLYGKTFDLAIILLVIGGLILPSRGAIEAIER